MLGSALGTIRADIGGKYLADPSLFYLTGPAWFFLSLLVVPNIAEPSVFLAASLANLVSLSSYLGLLLLARDTLFRNRHLRPIPLTAVVVVGAGLGAIKGAITVGIIDWMVPAENYGEVFITRVVSAGVVGVTMIAGAALILATRDRFQQESDALVALAENSALTLPALIAPVTESEDFLRVRTLVKTTREALVDTRLDANAPSSLLIEDPRPALRSLSHELWEKSRAQPDVFSLSSLLGSVFSSHRYPAWWVAIFYVMTVSLPFTLPLEGPWETLGRLVLLSALIGVTLSIVEKLPRTTAAWGFVHFAAAMVFVATVNEVASNAVFGPLGASPAVAIGVANFLAISMTCLIMSVFAVSLSTAHQVRSELEARFGPDYPVRVVEHRRHQLALRELAHTLHGSLHHSVNKRARKSAEVLGPQERERLLSDLDGLEKYLDGAQHTDEHHPEDWTSHLLSGIKRWDGLLDVTVDISLPSDPHPAVTRSLLPVINEGLANALRHGMAQTVTVSVSENDDHTVVDIIDDGVGFRAGKPGLGSALFDEVSGGKWSISATDTGAGSHLQVPLGRH